MNGRWLFDPAPYYQPGAGLWPGIPETVMSDDEVAELVWPGVNGGQDDERLAEVALWRR